VKSCARSGLTVHNRKDPIGHPARAEAQLVRLSLIYPLMDGSGVVDVAHLESAWEVWRFCRRSAQHIFVGGHGRSRVDRIAAVLGGGTDLDREQLDRMFHGQRSTADLRERAIATRVAVEIREETGGRDSVLLRAAEKTVKGPWWITPRLCDVDFYLIYRLFRIGCTTRRELNTRGE
jgi:hypothetical protein